MNDFSSIPWGLIAPLIILDLILIIIALFDWRKGGHFNGNKHIWLVVIVAISIVGPIIYFIFGRRKFT